MYRNKEKKRIVGANAFEYQPAMGWGNPLQIKEPSLLYRDDSTIGNIVVTEQSNTHRTFLKK